MMGASDSLYNCSTSDRERILAEEVRILVGPPLISCPFPWKLYQLLENAEQFGFQSIVSWQPDGNAFKVHDQIEFVRIILKTYFNQTQYKSFQRQINMYGFRRVTNAKQGAERGSYIREYFIRGEPEKCRCMIRNRVKGDGSKSAKSTLLALSTTPRGKSINNEANKNRKDGCLVQDAASSSFSPFGKNEYTRCSGAEQGLYCADDMVANQIVEPQNRAFLLGAKQQARRTTTTMEEASNQRLVLANTIGWSVPTSPQSSTGSTAPATKQDDNFDDPLILQDCWSTAIAYERSLWSDFVETRPPIVVTEELTPSPSMTAVDEVHQAHVSAISMGHSVLQPSVQSILPLMVMQNMTTAPNCISIPAGVIDEIINIFGEHHNSVSFAVI